MGNAADLLAAQRHGELPSKLWRGYIFVIEDCDASRKPSRLGDDSRWTMDERFANASYVERVSILCHRLVEEGLYSGAWAVATSQPPKFAWMEPDSSTTGFDVFASGLRGYLQAL